MFFVNLGRSSLSGSLIVPEKFSLLKPDVDKSSSETDPERKLVGIFQPEPDYSPTLFLTNNIFAVRNL